MTRERRIYRQLLNDSRSDLAYWYDTLRSMPKGYTFDAVHRKIANCQIVILELESELEV